MNSITAGTVFEMTFPLRGSDGHFRTFLTRIGPLRDAQRRVERSFGTNTDMTEQHAAQAALRDADQRKDDFLAMLAHELRNPLAPTRNAIALLGPMVPGAARAEARAIIERQSSIMVRLLDDLLDLSGISRGIVELGREVLDLHRLVEQIIGANRPLIEGLQHELAVGSAGDPLLVEADPTRLHQVVDNLQNAAKYRSGGPDRGECNLEADGIVLSVADTGIGLARESLERVFDTFSQIQSAEQGRSGVGIGLTVANNSRPCTAFPFRPKVADSAWGAAFGLPCGTHPPRPTPSPSNLLLESPRFFEDNRESWKASPSYWAARGIRCTLPGTASSRSRRLRLNDGI